MISGSLKKFGMFYCIMVLLSLVNSIVSIQFECDAISNTDFGRRFCFFRHISTQDLSNATILPNDIADEKRELILDNCTLYTLPFGIFQQFPHIKTIYSWNVQLQALKSETFRNAYELSMLDLSRNQIGGLDAHTFSLATNLMRLELSKNSLNTIDVDAFSGLDRLHTLNMDNNKLVFIPANVFTSLRQLKTIRLNHNSIKTIPVELFDRNFQLENIYLNDNAIEWMLGEQTFRHLSHVLDFDLHNNPITNLYCCVINAQSIDIRNTNAMGCSIGSRTKQILANDNRITFIDTKNGSAANLKHIDLANNRLTHIKNLTRFESLTYLDLSNNQINDIGLNSLAHMQHLEYLNLRRSGFNRIYFGSFSHKSNLKTLDISFNNLNHIDFRMFISMPNLRKLYIDGNNLTDIDMTEVHKLFPVLTTIGISMNNWNCVDLAAMIKYLEGNKITLDSEGVIKNKENIKGIPCNIHKNKQKNVLDVNSAPVQVYSSSTTTTPQLSNIFQNHDIITVQHNTDIVHSTKQCSNPFTKLIDTDVIVRLIDLKYQTLNEIESIKSISNKLENILNLIQN